MQGLMPTRAGVASAGAMRQTPQTNSRAEGRLEPSSRFFHHRKQPQTGFPILNASRRSDRLAYMPAPNETVNEEALFELTGFSSRAHLARSLDRQGVKYLRGLGGRLWTTLSALDRALGGTGPDPIDEVEF